VKTLKGHSGCGITRRCLESDFWFDRPDPDGIPIPRRPDVARITRAYKLRQQLVEALGALTARGSFLWPSIPSFTIQQYVFTHCCIAVFAVFGTKPGPDSALMDCCTSQFAEAFSLSAPGHRDAAEWDVGDTAPSAGPQNPVQP